MQKLRHQVNLIHRSTHRLLRVIQMVDKPGARAFLRKEGWLQLRRTLGLLWMLYRRKP